MVNRKIDANSSDTSSQKVSGLKDSTGEIDFSL